MAKTRDQRIILDACALIRGNLDLSVGSYAIPRSALEEVADPKTCAAIEDAKANGDLKVTQPLQDYVDLVREKARETGDIHSLSPQDIEVLACALQNGSTILTDDYAIQNTAAALELDTQGVAQKGITKTITWTWICPGCGKNADGPGECPICAHNTKKIPTK